MQGGISELVVLGPIQLGQGFRPGAIAAANEQRDGNIYDSEKTRFPPREKYDVPEPEWTRLRVYRAPKTGTSAAQYNGGMPPKRNGNGFPSIRMQTTDRPEYGAQDPQLSRSVGTGGRDGSGAQEGSAASAETQEDRDSDITDAAEMQDNKYDGVRDAGLWRIWQMKN